MDVLDHQIPQNFSGVISTFEIDIYCGRISPATYFWIRWLSLMDGLLNYVENTDVILQIYVHMSAERWAALCINFFQFLIDKLAFYIEIWQGACPACKRQFVGYKNQIIRCGSCGNIVWQPEGDFFSRGGRGRGSSSSKSDRDIIDVEFEEKWTEMLDRKWWFTSCRLCTACGKLKKIMGGLRGEEGWCLSDV